VIGDELKVFEVDGLIFVELNVEQVDVAGSDGGFTWMVEPSNV
jgi:hypothetical protein